MCGVCFSFLSILRKEEGRRRVKGLYFLRPLVFLLYGLNHRVLSQQRRRFFVFPSTSRTSTSGSLLYLVKERSRTLFCGGRQQICVYPSPLASFSFSFFYPYHYRHFFLSRGTRNSQAEASQQVNLGLSLHNFLDWIALRKFVRGGFFRVISKQNGRTALLSVPSHPFLHSAAFVIFSVRLHSLFSASASWIDVLLVHSSCLSREIPQALFPRLLPSHPLCTICR